MTTTKKRAWRENWIYWVILIIVVLWSMGPIYIVLMSAFKIPRDIFAYPPTLVPPQMTVNNFIDLARERPEFMRSLLNSTVITVLTILLTLGISLPTAYAFSRYRGRVYRQSATFIIAVRMFPPIIITVPLFPILNELRLADNHATLAVLYTAFNITFVTWIMKAFLDSIPREIEEAAYVDGASLFQVFRMIVIPLSRPVIVASAIITGTNAWNEFQFAFLFTSSSARTAPVIIAEMVGSLTGAQWGHIFAASVTQFLPALIFLWLIQNQLIHGMTSGAVKG